MVVHCGALSTGNKFVGFKLLIAKIAPCVISAVAAAIMAKRPRTASPPHQRAYFLGPVRAKARRPTRAAIGAPRRRVDPDAPLERGEEVMV